MPKRIDMPRERFKSQTVLADEVNDIIGYLGQVVLNRIHESGGMTIEILIPKSKKAYTLIGSIQLTKKKISGKLFYHVDLTEAHQKFAGYRLIPNVYHYLITQVGIPLQAGTSQSAGGRAMWNSLANMKGVKLLAVRGREIVELTKGEEGELVGKDDDEYSPYDIPSTKIVAMKAR